MVKYQECKNFQRGKVKILIWKIILINLKSDFLKRASVCSGKASNMPRMHYETLVGSDQTKRSNQGTLDSLQSSTSFSISFKK